MKHTLSDNLSVTPRESLYATIVARIDMEKVRHARRQFGRLVSGAIASFVLFIGAVQYATLQFTQSEFPQYLSLILSEKTDLFNYWREFLYALTESLPLLSITIFLGAFGVMLFFIQKTLKNFGSVLPHATLIS